VSLEECARSDFRARATANHHARCLRARLSEGKARLSTSNEPRPALKQTATEFFYGNARLGHNDFAEIVLTISGVAIWLTVHKIYEEPKAASKPASETR